MPASKTKPTTTLEVVSLKSASAAKPFFSGRISPDLFERVERHCAETGDTKTDVLVKALAAYLNCPTEPSFKILRANEDIKVLEDRLESIKLSLEESKLNTEERFKSVHERFNTLETNLQKSKKTYKPRKPKPEQLTLDFGLDNANNFWQEDFVKVEIDDLDLDF